MNYLELDASQKRKYIQRYFRKCLRMKDVANGFVYNSIGVPQCSTFKHAETIRAIGLIDELVLKAKRAIQIIRAHDQFVSIRLKTCKFEIHVAKDLDDLYFVIFQNAKDTHSLQQQRTIYQKSNEDDDEDNNDTDGDDNNGQSTSQ